MVEGLSKSFVNAKDNHVLQGFSMAPNLDPLSHLQFVDDNMLKSLLNTFLLALRGKINEDKSHILLFNTRRVVQRNINRALGFYQGSLHSKYMGIPLLDSLGKASLRNTFLKILNPNSRARLLIILT
jgi:hypothetical protein